MTQQQFAQRLGVSRNTLVRYEKGDRIPDATFLAQVISEFGIDANWLLLGVGEPPAPKLTPREAALLDNYRNSPAEEQRSLETMCALLAKRGGDEETEAGRNKKAG